MNRLDAFLDAVINFVAVCCVFAFIFLGFKGIFAGMVMYADLELQKDKVERLTNIDNELNEKIKKLESVDFTLEKLNVDLRNEAEYAYEETRKRVQDHIYRIKTLELNSGLAQRERRGIEDSIEDLVRPSFEYVKARSLYIYNRVNFFAGAVGSGIIVKEDEYFTYILTNRHVCGEGRSLGCYILEGEEKIELQKVKVSDTEYDMSLWKFRGKIEGKKPIEGIRKAKPGDKAYLVGSRRGEEFVYGEGVVAKSEEGYSLVQLPIYSGNSGSGILDKDGYLISLVFAMGIDFPINNHDNADHHFAIATHAICVNADILKEFLSDILDN